MSELHRRLEESIAYPEHDPRKASAEYRHVHHHLVVELDTPCWICGIRNSEGGKMETHHSELEWAAANGVDLPLITKDFPELSDHDKLVAWLDSEGNMLVLCATHHRGAWHHDHGLSCAEALRSARPN